MLRFSSASNLLGLVRRLATLHEKYLEVGGRRLGTKLAHHQGDSTSMVASRRCAHGATAAAQIARVNSGLRAEAACKTLLFAQPSKFVQQLNVIFLRHLSARCCSVFAACAPVVPRNRDREAGAAVGIEGAGIGQADAGERKPLQRRGISRASRRHSLVKNSSLFDVWISEKERIAENHWRQYLMI